MTDAEIRATYEKAIGRPMSQPHHVAEARAFIAAIFDALTPAGFIDGAVFAEEEWMVIDPTPIYRKPE